MIMPSVLAALCSAFQPLEGRVELAPFHIEWHGFKHEKSSESIRKKEKI